MTHEQTAALALLIARGAGNAFDMGREGDSPQGIAQAALQYASACGWHPIVHVRVVPSKAGNAPELAALESDLAEERRKVAALVGALRAVLESVPAPTRNAVTALEHARETLERVG